MTSDTSVFLRKASGVVRNVSASDTFIYNVGLINIGIGIAFIILLAPAFYPTTNMSLSIAITAIFCALQALTYYYFSVMMPRSGGDYTFISRALHPAIGFAMSLNMVFWLLFFSAVSAGYLANLGLAPVFSLLGHSLGSETLTAWGNSLTPAPGTFASATPAGFVIGTLAIIISAVLLIRGMRPYFRAQQITMGLALVGLLVLLVVLFTASPSRFAEGFAEFTGGLTADGVIQIATENEWATAPFTLSGSLAFMVWPFYPLAFGIMSASFAGEIKNINRSQLLGMPGSVIFAGIIFVLLVVGSLRLIGYDMLGAVAYNFFVAPDGSTTVMPWIGTLASLATSNVLWILLITLGFVMWTWFWIPGCMLYATRVMLAWSIDQLGPKALGEVNPRYNTPVWATVVAAIVAELFLVLYLFIPLFQALVGIGAMVITFAFIGLAAMVFPYRRKEIFEKSPLNQRLAGIPVMSILGLITFLYMSLMVYYFFTDPLVAANTPASLTAVIGVLVAGILLFFIARTVRRQQGIDVDLAYAEIPVE